MRKVIFGLLLLVASFAVFGLVACGEDTTTPSPTEEVAESLPKYGVIVFHDDNYAPPIFGQYRVIEEQYNEDERISQLTVKKVTTGEIMVWRVDLNTSKAFESGRLFMVYHEFSGNPWNVFFVRFQD